MGTPEAFPFNHLLETRTRHLRSYLRKFQETRCGDPENKGALACGPLEKLREDSGTPAVIIMGLEKFTWGASKALRCPSGSQIRDGDREGWNIYALGINLCESNFKCSRERGDRSFLPLPTPFIPVEN